MQDINSQDNDIYTIIADAHQLRGEVLGKLVSNALNTVFSFGNWRIFRTMRN